MSENGRPVPPTPRAANRPPPSPPLGEGLGSPHRPETRPPPGRAPSRSPSSPHWGEDWDSRHRHESSSPLWGEGFPPRPCASAALRKSHGGKGEGSLIVE